MNIKNLKPRVIYYRLAFWFAGLLLGHANDWRDVADLIIIRIGLEREIKELTK